MKYSAGTKTKMLDRDPDLSHYLAARRLWLKLTARKDWRLSAAVACDKRLLIAGGKLYKATVPPIAITALIGKILSKREKRLLKAQKLRLRSNSQCNT